jgi:hypothetical protein
MPCVKSTRSQPQEDRSAVAAGDAQLHLCGCVQPHSTGFAVIGPLRKGLKSRVLRVAMVFRRWFGTTRSLVQIQSPRVFSKNGLSAKVGGLSS